jgi:hypothetical protein
VAVDASPVMRMRCASVWAGACAGASSARRGGPCSRASRTASDAIARCTPTGRVTPCGRGALSYCASGALPSGLGAGAAPSGDRADTVWPALAPLLLGRREAQPLARRPRVPPPIVRGRVLWPLGYTTVARATAFP